MTLNMRTGQGAQPELIELISALGTVTGKYAFWVDHAGDVRFTQEGDPALPSTSDAKASCGIVAFRENFTPADMAADSDIVAAMMASLVST